MENKPNHLIHEKSPYLLQHAYNPVDWYPWGEAAIRKAKEEDKPILVSIGYSTCHWCHVMERETFEDPAIAKIMNENLVSIKIDREERPDLDKIYMMAVMTMTGSGGWPLNLFLTPDLKPFYGGTYFPPESAMNRHSWPKLVEAIGKAWKNEDERGKILEESKNFVQNLNQFFLKETAPVPLNSQLLDDAFVSFQSDYDAKNGGFGAAPKFPMPVIHNFLMRFSHFAGKEKKAEQIAKAALEISFDTLRKMAQGGIYDVVAGGFHRYSTDQNWRLPHFEKMLYDNAQIAINFIEAYQISRDPFFERVARETLDYLLRDMTHPEGGFYCAEDADSRESEGNAQKHEGAFYVWTKEEISGILGEKEGEIFSFHFNVQENGNVSDWQGEFKGKNVLIRTHSESETAAHFGISEEEFHNLQKSSLKKLFEVRAQRPRPGLDDKIISSWNGLALSAFAKAAQVFGNKQYLNAATRASQFIRKNLYDSETKTLFRRWREDERAIAGTLDDYAFLVQGLLDIYETSFQISDLEWAQELTEELLRRFSDIKEGGFYMSDITATSDLIAHIKEDRDGVEPCGSSVAVMNLLRLHALTDNSRYKEAAQICLSFFSSKMEQLPGSLPQMLGSLYFYLSSVQHILILGDSKKEDCQAILNEVYLKFLPNRVLILIESDETKRKISRWLPFTKDCQQLEGRPTAYVCANKTCRLPTNDVAALRSHLEP